MKVPRTTSLLLLGAVVLAAATWIVRREPEPARPSEERIRIVVEGKEAKAPQPTPTAPASSRQAATPTSTQPPRSDVPAASHARTDTDLVETELARARRRMTERGILLDDLPELRVHLAGVDQWRQKGNPDEALRLARFISEKVESVEIDRRFVERKWRRTRQLVKLRLGDHAESSLAEAEAHLRTALRAGAYDEANRLVNDFIRKNRLGG